MILDGSDTVRYIIQERIERRDRQIVRLDKKKRRNSTYTKLKKGFIYSIQYITYIYIYLFNQTTVK